MDRERPLPEAALSRLRDFEQEEDEDGARLVAAPMVQFARGLLEAVLDRRVPVPDEISSAASFGPAAFGIGWWQAGRKGEPRRLNMRHSLTIYLDATTSDVYCVSPAASSASPLPETDSEKRLVALADFVATQYNAALV